MVKGRKAGTNVRLRNGLIPVLTPAEREVFAWFQDNTVGKRPRQISASYDVLTAGTGRARIWLRPVLKRLEFKGYLEIVETHNQQGTRTANTYRVVDVVTGQFQ